MQATAYLMAFYPEEYKMFYKLVTEHEAKTAQKLGKEKFSVFQSNGKYDMVYRDRKCREKYLQKIIEIAKEIEK
jgi:hypothetical protein